MDTVLKTTHIVKKYGNSTILNGINMTIQKGDIYGFIGIYAFKKEEIK